MLTKFSVTNFKGFKSEIVFDLVSANGYAFNPSCIRNGIVNNSIIYGYNGCGKTNLCFGIFDILTHLTDKHREFQRYQNYLNAETDGKYASFCYEFLIDGEKVAYEYWKTDYKTIVYERLCISGVEVVVFDRSNDNKAFKSTLKGTETLNPVIEDPTLSALKYIKNNSVLSTSKENKVFASFFQFVEGMLFFRSLEDRMYIGQDVDSKGTITSEIIERGKVDEFEKFLNDGNVKCKLAIVETLNGGKDIAFDFGKKRLPLASVMSTGTSSMMLFFYWHMLIQDAKVSMVIIDEFDAFYHHELSLLIIKKLMESGVQFVLTTHNTSLMTNRLMRPDCYFLMGNNNIRSLSHCTEKELREVHNIEKIYKAGGFYVG